MPSYLLSFCVEPRDYAPFVGMIHDDHVPLGAKRLLWQERWGITQKCVQVAQFLGRLTFLLPRSAEKEPQGRWQVILKVSHWTSIPGVSQCFCTKRGFCTTAEANDYATWLAIQSFCTFETCIFSGSKAQESYVL